MLSQFGGRRMDLARKEDIFGTPGGMFGSVWLGTAAGAIKCYAVILAADTQALWALADLISRKTGGVYPIRV